MSKKALSKKQIDDLREGHAHLGELEPDEQQLFGDYQDYLKHLGYEIPADIFKGASMEEPIGKDLWSGGSDTAEGADRSRIASSFGNPKGISKQLLDRGYSAAGQNSKGELVARGPDKRWYRDQTNFFKPFNRQVANPLTSPWQYAKDFAEAWTPEHPVNWAESKAGYAYPLVGMAAAGAAATPESFGTATIPAAMAGGAAGEAIRGGLGSRMGFYDATPMERVNDAAIGGMEAGMNEMGGQVINKIPLPRTYIGLSDKRLGGMRMPTLKQSPPTNVGAALRGSIQNMRDAVRENVGVMGEGMTGVSREAIEHTAAKPNNVLDPPTNQQIAEAGQAELRTNISEQGARIHNARIDARARNLNRPVPTRSAIGMVDQTLQDLPINSQGQGLMTPEEVQILQDLRNKSLITQTATLKPEPGALSSKLQFEEKPVLIPGNGEFTPVKTVMQMPKARPPQGRGGLTMQPFSEPLPVAPPVPQPTPRIVQAGPMQGVHYSPYVGAVNEMPYKDFSELQGTADALGSEIGADWDKNGATQRSDAFTSKRKQLYGEIKDAMHAQDPVYGAEDTRNTGFKTDAKTIGQLNNDRAAEGAAGGFFGKNKTEQNAAASRAIPDTADTLMKDRAASQEFEKPAFGSHWLPTPRTLARGLVSGGAGAWGFKSGDPSFGMYAPAAIMGVTSPKLWKYGVAYGSKTGHKLVSPWLNALQQGQIAPSLLQGLDLQNQNTPWMQEKR